MKKIESAVRDYLNDEVEKLHLPDFSVFIENSVEKKRRGNVSELMFNFSFYTFLMLFISASVFSALKGPPRLSGSVARCYEITSNEAGYNAAMTRFSSLYYELRKYYTEDN